MEEEKIISTEEHVVMQEIEEPTELEEYEVV